MHCTEKHCRFVLKKNVKNLCIMQKVLAIFPAENKSRLVLCKANDVVTNWALVAKCFMCSC